MGFAKVFQLSSRKREKMIVIIQELHRLKKYKIETLFTAVQIADSYLRELALKNELVPELVAIATISILMAAKVEEPVSPSFSRMINLLQPDQKNLVTRQNLILLEMDVIRRLQFEVLKETVVPFVERYIMLLEVQS